MSARPDRIGPDFELERAHLASGARWIAGVDEVGRGPLAGPVTVAAVILDPGAIPDGLDDSKVLSAERRRALADAVFGSALAVSIAMASAAEIDEFNIRGATLRAMARALGALDPRPDFALIDGRDAPPGLICRAQPVIGGDRRSLSISAASIVAKVTRDSLMTRLDAHYPGYGFARHAGYPTSAHREALERLGPCPLHRRSFHSKPRFEA